MSNPLEDRRLPNVSPIPANSVTGLSDMGSAIKFLCFCDVVDMVFVKCFNQESKLGSFLLFAGAVIIFARPCLRESTFVLKSEKKKIGTS